MRLAVRRISVLLLPAILLLPSAFSVPTVEKEQGPSATHHVRGAVGDSVSEWEGDLIFAWVSLVGVSWLKGEPHGPELKFRHLGGTVDNVTILTSHGPKLRPGLVLDAELNLIEGEFYLHNALSTAGDASPGGRGFVAEKHWRATGGLVTHITYQINEAGSTADIPGTNEFPAVRQGFAAWSQINAMVDFVEGPPVSKDTNTIAIRDGVNQVGWSFTVFNDVLCFSADVACTVIRLDESDPNRILEVDTWFNDNDRWGISPSDLLVYDVQGVATHEAGHWLHLADLRNDEDFLQTMYFKRSTPVSSLIDKTLFWGDIAGARYIYPKVFWNFDWVGAATSGGDAAVYDINGNGKFDLVVAWVDDALAANRIFYRIAWDISPGDGSPASWQSGQYEVIVPTGEIGWDTAGLGVAIANIGGSSMRPEIIVMWIDNPNGSNSIYFSIGLDMDTSGVVAQASWRGRFAGPGPIADITEGGGISLAYINLNDRFDSTFAWIEVIGGARYLKYTTYLDLDTNGVPSSQGPVNTASPNLSDNIGEMGLNIEDLNEDGSKDLVVTWSSEFGFPAKSQLFYNVNWGLDATGFANSWGLRRPIPGSWEVTDFVPGIGIGIQDVNQNGRPDSLFAFVRDLAGENMIEYRVDWETMIWPYPLPYRQEDAGVAGDAGNNSIATRQLIEGTYRGFLIGQDGSGDLEDWYSWQLFLSEADAAQVSVVPPLLSDFDLYVYRPDGSLFAASQNGVGLTETITWTVSSEGTWLVRVKMVQGIGVYSLSLARSVQIGGGSPHVSTWDGTTWRLDNNVIPAAEHSGGLDAVDKYKLQMPLARSGGKLLLKLSEFENAYNFLDRVGLAIVDHDASFNIALTPSGEILTYISPTPAPAVSTSNGTLVTELLTEPDGVYFQQRQNDYILINFTNVEIPSTAKLIVRSDVPVKKSWFDVFLLLRNGTWKDMTDIFPRKYWYDDGVNLTPYLSIAALPLVVKIGFDNADFHKIDFVGLDTTPQEQVRTSILVLQSATHSVFGDITAYLVTSDDVYVDMIPGEYITLDFKPSQVNLQKGMVRDYIITVDGHYYVIPS